MRGDDVVGTCRAGTEWLVVKPTRNLNTLADLKKDWGYLTNLMKD